MSKKDSTNYFVPISVTAEYIIAIEERRDNLKEAAESIKQHNKIANFIPKNVDEINDNKIILIKIIFVLFKVVFIYPSITL